MAEHDIQTRFKALPHLREREEGKKRETGEEAQGGGCHTKEGGKGEEGTQKRLTP